MAVKSICGAILMARDPGALARFYADAPGLSFTREDHAGDPEGNLFELVELAYELEGGGGAQGDRGGRRE